MSGNSLGALRAEIKPGVREIHLCKDERGKTGLRLQAIDKVGLGSGGRGGQGPRATQRESSPAAEATRAPPRASGVLATSSTSGRRWTTVRRVLRGAGAKAHLSPRQARPLHPLP